MSAPSGITPRLDNPIVKHPGFFGTRTHDFNTRHRISQRQRRFCPVMRSVSKPGCVIRYILDGKYPLKHLYTYVSTMINCLSGTYNYKGIEIPEGGDMPTKMSSNQIKDKVRTWLMEDGWSLKQETPPAGLWAFVATDQFGRIIGVGQRKDKEDEVVIQGAISIGDDTNDRITRLTDHDRNDLLWDLRFELVKTNLEFIGIALPLKRIEVVQRIFLDGLTKDCFLQRTSEVRKGVLIVIWLFARKLGQPPPPTQMGFQR